MKQEAFVKRWHYFLIYVQQVLDTVDDDALRKKVSMLILQSFYLEPFSKDADFYELFEQRLTSVKKVIDQLKGALV